MKREAQKQAMTAAQRKIALDRMHLAAPVMLAALERVGCQDQGLCGPNEPDGLCFVCAAITEARGIK